MKLLATLFVALGLLASQPAFAGGEVKEKCTKNEKTGKEVCKKIKVHKKLEGKEIPTKK